MGKQSLGYSGYVRFQPISSSQKLKIQSLAKLAGGPKQSEFMNPDGTKNREAYLKAYYDWKEKSGKGSAPKATSGGEGRSRNVDPNRKLAWEILKQIPILTNVPSAYQDVTKEVFAPDHHCFWYMEEQPDGHYYTVEFHVDPSEEPVVAEIYVQNDDNEVIYHEYFGDFEDMGLEAVDDIDTAIQDEVDANIAGNKLVGKAAKNTKSLASSRTTPSARSIFSRGPRFKH